MMRQPPHPTDPGGLYLPPMLALEDILLQISESDPPQRLLDGVSARMKRGELVAIVGPSGCGKSTLLKIIAGLLEPSEGVVRWDGRDLATEGDLSPSELGYVPQFSLAHEALTVQECVDYAARLRVAALDRAERADRVAALLEITGLTPLADRQARVLSGGQRRRLSLAIEMVSSPPLLLCDEVTSGLDPGSAQEILTLLHELSRSDGGKRRLVVNVTHSLADLHLYDRIIAMSAGVIVYNGPSEHFAYYFGLEQPDAIFNVLKTRPAEEWKSSWNKHGPYFDVPAAAGDEAADATDEPADATDGPAGDEAPGSEQATPETARLWTQYSVVLERRLRLFVRERAQLGLQAALIVGFPCLVAVFAYKGLPQIRNLSLENNLSVVEQLRESASYLTQAFDVGGLVSGLLLFQVILLALMGSNNGALEVAGERMLFEREKLAGLSTEAYLAAKATFLALLITAQAIWMVLFVHWVCSFPGDIFGQAALLWLANAAVTAVCLGFSSVARTSSQASLISVYFVGFQLPLSGAVLALPDAIAQVTRPFIAAYWSWAGAIQTMRDTRFYDLILTITKTELASVPTCYGLLLAQIAIGVCIAYLGCRRSVWD